MIIKKFTGFIQIKKGQKDPKVNFIFLLCCLFGSIFSSLGQSSTITTWKENAIGAIWNDSTNTVAFGKKDANGVYKIYLSDSLGNNEQPLTYSGWDSNRHQWAEEWHPSGDYLFCYVEKTEYLTESDHTRIPDDAIPGYGAYTDIWLIKRDGSQAWQLTNLPNDYDNGVIHGAISRDGQLFAWSERILAPNVLDMNLAAGAYIMKVADISVEPTPMLVNIRTFQPDSLLAANELESISNDHSTLLFYSTFESQNLFATPIYSLNMPTNTITKLTSESFAQAPTFSPDGTKIVYMTGHECDIFPFEIQGADWWIMNPNGSNKQRLTRMNVKNDPQSVNHYRLAGSISFVDNTSFFGGVMTNPLGLTGKTVKVEINPNIDELNPNFHLFPNPTEDQLTIQIFGSLEDEEIIISDVIGQHVCTERVNQQKTISIGDLSDGIYYMRLKSNKNVVAKFIKL